MIIIIAFILIVLIIWGIYTGKDDSFFGPVGIVSAICVIATLVLIGLIAHEKTLDNKIAMYTKENQKIEEEIGTLVQEYMNYESNTYIETKNKNVISLVSLYPELKADELIKKQIDIHTNNNATIKSLKEEKLNIANYKFWLYFGG